MLTLLENETQATQGKPKFVSSEYRGERRKVQASFSNDATQGTVEIQGRTSGVMNWVTIVVINQADEQHAYPIEVFHEMRAVTTTAADGVEGVTVQLDVF